jgi:hypothetical protein
MDSIGKHLPSTCSTGSLSTSSEPSARPNLCDRSEALKAAIAILGSFRRDDSADPEVFSAACVALFMGYPREAVAALAPANRHRRRADLLAERSLSCGHRSSGGLRLMPRRNAASANVRRRQSPWRLPRRRKRRSNACPPLPVLTPRRSRTRARDRPLRARSPSGAAVPPTGNGSWSADKAESVKDRWIFPLRDDPARVALLPAQDEAILRRVPLARYAEPGGVPFKAVAALL